MQRLRISEKSGPEFSRLAFGTWRLFDDAGASSPEGLLARLKTCLDLGITTVDTAEIYGGYRVEELIGAALRRDPGVKSRLEIVSKAGIYIPCEFHPDRKTAFYDTTASRLVKSAEKSLRLLGIECLDLFLVHRPDWLTASEETASGLNRLLKDGKIRAAGVSNYSAAQFRALQAFTDAPLATNQLEFSPFCLDPIFDGTFDQCQEFRVHPMAWSPTGGGRLFQKHDATAERLRATMANLAEKYGGATHDQLCYAWILAHPASPIVVSGTNKIPRLQSIVKATSFHIDREDWFSLSQAARDQGIP
jgi:predicted oxidoreductase